MFYESASDDYVTWYILALFDYGLPISNLSQRQLGELWDKILHSIENQMPHEDFFVKGELEKIDMPYHEESFRLARIKSYSSYVDLRTAPLIGFYNRRLIIKLALGTEEFLEIRTIRDDILRDLKFVFEDLKGIKVSAIDPKQIGEKPWEVKDVFFFPLIIVPDGMDLIKQEYITAKKNDIDLVYSIPSTSLSYTLPERGRWFNLFSFKEHFIRLSVRSVMVFCDGTIPLEFTQTLVNAIYQGGIFEQMRRINELGKPLTRQRMRAIDDDILLNLAETLREMVKTNIEAARIAEKQRFISFLIATLSFIISLCALFFTIFVRL